MSNTAANPDSVARQTKSATLKGLLQAAVLACVLVPLGTVALEGSTWYFSCNIENTEGCSGEDTSYTFGFGDYYLMLMFDMNAGGFIGIDVTPTTIGTPGESETFSSKADAFPGYECLAVTQSGQCVEFEVTPFMGSAGEDWDGYTIEIGWNKIDGQDLEEARMTLLVDRDEAGLDGDYDYDVCASSLYDDCDIDPDPRIRSGDTDFSTWVPSYRPATSVPEPSTLLLLGAGLSAAGLRRRRRS